MSQVPPSPYEYEQHSSRSYSSFFLVTLPLAIVSWGVSLISQAVVTARIGNDFVGPLWFAIVLQTFIILGIAYGILNNKLQYYHSTLSTFASLVVVFAVIGVDRNIFNPIIPAQRALSAGWLVAAIVNSIWILYFTSSPSSPLRHVLDVELQSAPKKQPPPQPQYIQSIPSVPTNVDAFTYPHANVSDHSRTQRTSTIPDGRTGTGSAAMTDTRVVSGAPTDTHVTSEPSIAAGSARGQGSAQPPDVTAAAAPELSAAGGPSAEDGAPAGGPVAPEKKERTFPYRAEALYCYEAEVSDPNELSFSKGDILEISDISGKWWEGRKSDGTIGIAPSNYLRIL